MHTMIANARMYSVTPVAGELWRALLSAIAQQTALPISVVEHSEPAPISDLWGRDDQGAVFMCGLPYARSEPRPALVAAPVPSPASFRGQPQYWSELVVREDSRFQALEDTFGQRIAFTTPESQSGCFAALGYFMEAGQKGPLYREVIAPQITPLGAMTAVIGGAAEVAPIDSYAFCLLQKYRPELTSQLRVVARTAPTAIPPIVASYPGLESLEAAFLEAHNTVSIRPVMASLLLERFVRPEPASYDRVRERFEAATRFWREHPFASVAHPAFATLTSRLR
jgi:ABC-type phosphate/phosphonate transport system substrate-binding protein